jgi:hypothetical protein
MSLGRSPAARRTPPSACCGAPPGAPAATRPQVHPGDASQARAGRWREPERDRTLSQPRELLRGSCPGSADPLEQADQAGEWSSEELGKLLRRSGLAEAARAADGVRTLVIPFARRQAAPVERIADGPLRAPLAARAQAYATDADLILTWHRGHADRHILRAGRARRASSRLAFVVIAAQLAEFFLAAAQEGEGQHRREDPHVGLVPDRERERKRSYGRRIQRESAIAPPPRRSAPAARPAIFPGERPLAGAVSSPQAKGPS